MSYTLGRHFCELPVPLERVMCPVCERMIHVTYGDFVDDNHNWWWAAIAVCKCGFTAKTKERYARWE